MPASAIPIAWITHAECLRHEIEPGHPESPARLTAIEEHLHESGLHDFLQSFEAPRATVEQLLRVHDRAYVDELLSLDASATPVMLDSDTVVGAHTQAAALHAVGANVLATDLVLDDRASLAFCAVRPPGHHAERARAMGFCFFNNIAVAAAHALARGLSRVAVLDFDVHYGNGTARMFQRDRRVLVANTYQERLYPHWESEPFTPNLIDVPLPAGTGGLDFREAVTSTWLPAVNAHKPELILVSAGFDAHASDPLADLRLSSEDYYWLGSTIRDLARRHSRDRVVATLEGGYDTVALARSVRAFIQAFADA